MLLPANIAAVVVDSIVGRIALLLLGCDVGDLAAARHSASRMLAAYEVCNEEELRLAGEIISFGLHALDALSKSTNPDLTLNQLLRLRSNAVNLSRESYKWQRQLEKLQRARRAGVPDQAQAEIPAVPSDALQSDALPADALPADVLPSDALPADATPAPIELAPIEPVQVGIQPPTRNAGQTWTQSYRQRLTAKRLAARELKRQRKQAAHANRPNAAIPAATATK